MEGIVGTIYMIVNTVTDEKYIGQTIQTLHERWRGHLKVASRLRRSREGEILNNVPSSSYLYNAMVEWGTEWFDIRAIEENVPGDKLGEREIHYIREHSTLHPGGYNCLRGGGNILSRYDEDTKQRMSAIAKANAPALIDKYRKEETKGLPMNIVSHNKGNSHGYAVCGHPLCSYKSFTLVNYPNMDACKEAAITFLANLEANDTPYVCKKKTDESLPVGITLVANGFTVTRKVRGVLYKKTFSSKKVPTEEKLAAAMAYLATIPN